jgi:hypothetical protein
MGAVAGLSLLPAEVDSCHLATGRDGLLFLFNRLFLAVVESDGLPAFVAIKARRLKVVAIAATAIVRRQNI